MDEANVSRGLMKIISATSPMHSRAKYTRSFECSTNMKAAHFACTFSKDTFT